MGIFMSIGKGSAYTSSCKQKRNTKSNMEASYRRPNGTDFVDKALSSGTGTANLPVTQSTKTTKVLFYYQRMTRHLAVGIQITSMYGISL